MLVQELERSLLRGDESAGNELVLQELRRAIRADAQPVPRIGDAARMFFAPLEPFLIDGRADHKRIGRIARVSLEPIWSWIGRDLIPAEAKALGEDINRALLADDRTKAEQLVRALHERAVQRMKDAIAEVGADEKARRRLAVQVGTPRAIEDLEHDCFRSCRCATCLRIWRGDCRDISARSSANRSIRSRRCSMPRRRRRPRDRPGSRNRTSFSTVSSW